MPRGILICINAGRPSLSDREPGVFLARSTMTVRTRAAVLEEVRPGRRLFVAALLVIAALFLTIATTASSHACPVIDSGNSAVSLARTPSATVMDVSAPSAELKAHNASHCFEGSLHVSGPSCASGCCPACSAFFFSAAPDFYRDDHGKYGLTSQDGLSSAKSDPDFRPPRLFFS